MKSSDKSRGRGGRRRAMVGRVAIMTCGHLAEREEVGGGFATPERKEEKREGKSSSSLVGSEEREAAS